MSKNTFRIGNQFNSSARIIEIKRFHLGEFKYSLNDNLSLTKLDYEFQYSSGWWPKFPVLIQSNGLPWEVGNAYLLKILEKKQPWDMETLKTRAIYLLAYLRFLEDCGIDFMHFPYRKSERVTYIFKDKLQEFISQGLNPAYASNIINAVVDFYRVTSAEGIIDEKSFENTPFENTDRFIKFIDEKGFGRFKTITTSDLAIRHTKPAKRLDRIEDGGQLRPLSAEEQMMLLDGFKKQLCPYNLELMMKISLSTGARIQTVCTLRICHIKRAYEQLQRYGGAGVEIQAGNGAKYDGHLINTKRGRLHRLLFSRDLIEKLYVYSESEYHRKLMVNSYYGCNDRNYIFLTENSASYYISKQEIIDRQNSDSHGSVNSKDFIQNRGETVRMNLKKFQEKIRRYHPNLNYFRFHDLRATFGMNLVLKLEESGSRSARVLTEVRSRMGHSNISTTQQYLDFNSDFKKHESLSLKFEEEFFGGYLDKHSGAKGDNGF